MDIQAKLEQLRLNSFDFEVDLTLEEMEWARVLGQNGMGHWLFLQTVELGSEFFDLGSPQRDENGDGERYRFQLEGHHAEFRLPYSQSFTANLLTGVRSVLDGVNGALRRATVPVRFVAIKESCAGLGCTYRVMLAPAAWLGQMSDAFNVVAGVSLDDYEFQPAPWRLQGDDAENFFDLRHLSRAESNRAARNN